MKKVPALRFSGFEGVWEEKFIGDLYKNLSTGMTPYRGIPEYYNGDILWITSGELNYNYIKDTKEKITITAVRDTNLKIYTPGTFFIAITGLEAPGTRGKCAINALPATTNQSCMAFEELPSLKSIFLFYWYNKYGVKLYYGFAQGTKQQSFNNKIVEGFKLHLPTLPEQQKIAAFLTSVDTRIQQLTRKKVLLEQYKKGAMQQLFSQEIRFKDDGGREFPEWEEKRIKDLVEIKYGKDQKEVISDNGRYSIFGTGGEIGKTNHFLFDRPSILIGRKGTIDKPRYIDVPFWTVDTLFYTIPFDNINAKWLFHKFETINWYLYNEASGVPSLSASTIYQIKISLPSLPEQQKIASFLTALDEKINNTAGQIARMQAWKKGLLQRMFV